jgi:hypothetical protein
MIKASSVARIAAVSFLIASFGSISCLAPVVIDSNFSKGGFRADGRRV